jgi:hypothetical protein
VSFLLLQLLQLVVLPDEPFFWAGNRIHIWLVFQVRLIEVVMAQFYQWKNSHLKKERIHEL